MKKLITLSILLTSIITVSQNIVFDAEGGKFIDNIKEMNPNEKGDILIKNFNPFLYEINISISYSDNNSKVIPFILSIPGRFFGLSVGDLTSLKANSDNKSNGLGIKSTNNAALKKFEGAFKNYLDLYDYVRTQPFSCSEIKKLIANTGNDKLTDLYLNIGNSDFDESFIQFINNLDVLKTNTEKYLEKVDEKDCTLKVKSFTAKGEETYIQVSLKQKNEASSFFNLVDEISNTKTIKTKGSKKIRFTTGILFSKNVNPDFYLQSDTNGQYTIVREKKESYLPGLSLLANFEIDKDRFYLNFGGGVTIEAVPHLLIGGSYQLNTLINGLYINAGYGWAYRNTLSDSLDENQTYTSAPSLKTKKQFIGDLWFGLSFKL